MATIGSQLKKARQQAQLTINDVYLKTKISPDTISTLEDDGLMAKASSLYIKSFLKKYALYLGLDDKAILRQYSDAFCTTPQNTSQDIIRPPRKASTVVRVKTEYIKGLLRRFLWITLLVLIAVFIIRSAALIMSSFARLKSVRGEQQAIRHKTKSAPKRSLPVPPDPPSEAGLKEVVLSIPKNEKLNLVVSLNDDVWTEVKRDGEIVFKGILKKDTVKQWQADDHFEFWTGNACAMEFTLNGFNIGNPGRGVKKGIIIDRNGMRK
ncbi:MAG: RodZ domain-containing protein [Candidatus Omnitrophota bacterium]|jgi:hypothetical protein